MTHSFSPHVSMSSSEKDLLSEEEWIEQWKRGVERGDIATLKSCLHHPHSRRWTQHDACEPFGMLYSCIENRRGPEIYEAMVFDPVLVKGLELEWSFNPHEGAELLYRRCAELGDLEGMKWLDGLWLKNNPYGGEMKRIDYSALQGAIFVACCQSGNRESIEYFLKEYPTRVGWNSDARETVLLSGYMQAIVNGDVPLIEHLLLHPDLKSVNRGISPLKMNIEPARLWIHALKSPRPQEMIDCFMRVLETPGYYGREHRWTDQEWLHWNASSPSPYKDQFYSMIRVHYEHRELQRSVKDSHGVHEKTEESPITASLRL